MPIAHTRRWRIPRHYPAAHTGLLEEYTSLPRHYAGRGLHVHYTSRPAAMPPELLAATFVI